MVSWTWTVLWLGLTTAQPEPATIVPGTSTFVSCDEAGTATELMIDGRGRVVVTLISFHDASCRLRLGGGGDVRDVEGRSPLFVPVDLDTAGTRLAVDVGRSSTRAWVSVSDPIEDDRGYSDHVLRRGPGLRRRCSPTRASTRPSASRRPPSSPGSPPRCAARRR